MSHHLLLVKWKVVPQIVDRDSGNLYPIYPLFPCSDFLSKCVCVWGGGGGSRKTFFLRKTIISHFMFSSRFMLFPTFLETATELLCYLLSPAAPKARDGRYCNAPRPSVRPSVCLSVRLSVCPSRLVFAL